MKQCQTVCYADTKVEIATVNRHNDTAVSHALRGMAVIPAYVEYDEKIERQAYKRFTLKYSHSKARALADFCAKLLGYHLYGDKDLSWAMSVAEARVRI